MAKGLIKDSTLTAIADAIRAKTGTTERILPVDMAAMIEAVGGKAEIMKGTFKTTSDTGTANLGTTIPDSDNCIFVCTARSGLGYAHTSSISSPIVVCMVAKIKGVKEGWLRCPPESTAGNDRYVSSATTIKGDTISNAVYDFEANVTYEWWYMYV